MASTRINNDPIRIRKTLQQVKDQAQYQLNVPGNGVNMPLEMDPHIRLQKWGANFAPEFIDIENKLFTLDRKLMRGCLKSQVYTPIDMSKINYDTYDSNVDSTTINDPSWNLRDRENNHTFEVIHESQENKHTIPFDTNLGTRIHEKDLFCSEFRK